jgi:hypothetical protein
MNTKKTRKEEKPQGKPSPSKYNALTNEEGKKYNC